MKNGTSDPIASAIFASASRGKFVSNSLLSASSTEAASLLPPPNPAPCGIFFLSSIEIACLTFVVAKRNRRDKGLDFVKTIVAPAQNLQGQIDLRGSENLHICHVEHIRDIPG